MKGRAVFMLVTALVLAGFAVFLTRDWLQKQVQPVVVQEQRVPLTTVVVANSPLYFGNRIGREHVREVEWPAGSVPPGVFESIDELLGGDKPRVVLRRIEVGEPILTSKVTGDEQRATLSALVSEDMRAITIRVNDVIGVAGFILPGDRVDLLLTRENGETQLITDVLLQNVTVLGIDQTAGDKETEPAVVKAVTLEVTPIQAQKVVLAAQIGSLSLALRNQIDVAATTRETITVADLQVGEHNKEAQAQVAAEPEVQVVEKVVEKVVYKEPHAPKVDGFATVNITRGVQTKNYKVDAEGLRAIARRPPLDLLRRIAPPPATVGEDSGPPSGERAEDALDGETQ